MLTHVEHAGLAHHFGTRDALLEALPRHGGRRIRDAVTDATGRWLAHAPTVQRLIDGHLLCVRHGYGELAFALHAAGWRDKGSGMLTPVVDALQNLRPLQAVGGGHRVHRHSWPSLLHQALATETAYGAAFAVAPASAIPPPATLSPNDKVGINHRDGPFHRRPGGPVVIKPSY